MKRIILIAATAVMAAAASMSAASASTPGYYFSGLAGASWLPTLPYRDTTGKSDTSFQTGFAYGGALGYDNGDGWRFELDSVHQMASVDQFGGVASSGHLFSTSLMANVTKDLMEDTEFTPYVGAGLGLQDVGGMINGFSGEQWKPAYQLEAGLRKDLSPQLSLFGEYRFSQSEAVKLSAATDIARQHFSDHLLTVGLTYHLGD